MGPGRGQRRLSREGVPWLALTDGQCVACEPQLGQESIVAISEGRAPWVLPNIFQLLPHCVDIVVRKILSWHLTFYVSDTQLWRNFNVIKFEINYAISAGSLGVEGPKWLLWTWLLGKHLLVVMGWVKTMGMIQDSSTLGSSMKVQKRLSDCWGGMGNRSWGSPLAWVPLFHIVWGAPSRSYGWTVGGIGTLVHFQRNQIYLSNF